MNSPGNWQGNKSVQFHDILDIRAVVISDSMQAARQGDGGVIQNLLEDSI